MALSESDQNLLSVYSEYLESQGYTPKTAYAYISHVRSVLRSVGGTVLAKDQNRVQEAFNGFAPSTVAMRRSAWRKFAEFLLQGNTYQIANLPKRTGGRKRTDQSTPAQTPQFATPPQQASQAPPSTNSPVRAIPQSVVDELRLCVNARDTTLRQSDIPRLQWSGLEDTGIGSHVPVRIVRGRYIMIDRHVLNELHQWACPQRSNDPLVPSEPGSPNPMSLVRLRQLLRGG